MNRVSTVQGFEDDNGGVIIRPDLALNRPVMRPKENHGWKSVGDVEIAVAEYVDWFNHRRLHGEIGLIPPAEYETNHWSQITPQNYSQLLVPTGVGSK